MMKQWQRFILFRFWTILISLSIFSFIFYSLIHYSIHLTKAISANEVLENKNYFLYYLAEISLKLDFLLPQLITITIVTVLSSMQRKRESIFLQSSGLSLKKIIFHLLLSGLFLSLLVYANFQWITPYSENLILNEKTQTKKNKLPCIFHMKDNIFLICNNIDLSKKLLSDVFLIMNTDFIYKMESLIFAEGDNLPTGFNVIKFSRDKMKNLEAECSLNIIEFPTIEFLPYENPFLNIFSLKEKKSLSNLFKMIPWKGSLFGCSKQIPKKILEIIVDFFYKVSTPFACITAIIIPSGFCLKFSRMKSFSSAYLIPLGVINLFFIQLKAISVLASNGIIPCAPFILGSLLFLNLFSLYKFVKI